MSPQVIKIDQAENHNCQFEIFEGRLGGGKTYSATVRIIDRLRRGGIVGTNIALNWEALQEVCARRWAVQLELDKQLFILTEDQIAHFYKYIPLGTGRGMNPLVVMDEFHLWFNAYDALKTAQGERPTLNFITQARKKHVDLILISQSALNVNKQFVRQLHAIWRFRDMAKFKIPGLGLPAFGFRDRILTCQYDQDGKTLAERFWVKKDPDVFRCYSTDALLRPITDLSENVVGNIALQKIQKEPLHKKHKNTLKLLAFSTLITLTFLLKILWLNY